MDYANFSILYDYYIHGAEYWLIRDLGDLENNREPLKTLLTALAVNNHVKYIQITLSLLNYDEIVLFANSLEKNNSVDSLYLKWISGYDEDPEPARRALERLLITLSSRTKSLEKLLIFSSHFNLDPVKENIVAVLRNNTELRRFDISLEANDETVLKIIKQIGDSCHKMKYLVLSADTCHPENVLFELAEMIGKSRTLQRVEFSTNEDYEWDDAATDQFEKLLGTENKALRYLDISMLRRELDVVAENKKSKPDVVSTKINSDYVRERAYGDWIKKLSQQEANFDLMKLPADLIFAVLVFTGDLETIRSFFKTSKYWNNIARKQLFWKHMVNSFLPVIDPDVLSHTDAFYAKNLEEYGAKRANFWELLFQHSFHYLHSPAKEHTSITKIDKFAPPLPFHHPKPSSYIHEQLLTAIFRRWPNANTHVQLIKVNVKQHTFSKIEKPYCWMQLSFGYTNLYHIIIQTYGNEKITGLFFVCSNSQSFFNDPFDYIQTPLDYFVAYTVDEALNKMKKMMDTWCGALGPLYELSSSRKPLVRSVMEDAVDKHQFLRQDIALDVDRIVAKIMERWNVVPNDGSKIADLIEKMTKRLRELPIVYYTEISDRKYKLPDRYSLHLQYPKETLHNISFYEHDRSGNWGQPTNSVSKQASTQPKQKISKPSVKATLSKLIHIIMNFVVMPVLKVLWPRHRGEVDKGYSGSCNGSQKDTTLVGYYFSRYQPLSKVTITDSYPQCWPITAVVMAKQILVKLGQLTEYLVITALKRDSNVQYNIDDLIEDLSHYNLIPQKHLNGLKSAITDLLRQI